MLTPKPRSVLLGRSASRILNNAGMATAAPRIGDRKVEMSPLEQGNYINYQRIEDNLSVVRGRLVLTAMCIEYGSEHYHSTQTQSTSHLIRKDSIRSFG